MMRAACVQRPFGVKSLTVSRILKEENDSKDR